MAVVEMTTLKNVSSQTRHTELKAEFDWTPQQKGLVLSSFSYGRLFCSLGGYLAGKIGGSTIYCIGYLVMSLITFFTPFLLAIDFTLFVIVYLVLGFFESFIFSGVPQIFSRWAPPDERSKFVSFGVVGYYVGSVTSFVVSGWVLKEYSWQILFYGSGITSLVWTCTWFFVVKNDPEDDGCISESEKQYIRNELNSRSTEEKLTYPWKQIFTSSALWIASLAEFTTVGGYIFTSMHLPQYIKDTKISDIQQIGYISTIPSILAIVSMPVCGCLCDYIRSHKILSITNIHRLSASIGLFSAAFSFAVVTIWPNFIIDIVAISVFQFFSTFTIIDVHVFILDFAPKYAAFLMSVVNTIATFAGIIVPALVAFIVTSHSLSQWNICFVVFSIMYFMAALFYLKFVSGEQAFWANGNSNKETNESNEKKL